jgi:dTDP-N-acetylfucosamine:lipid II N-acetylfucosaminyltransferase
MFVHIFANQTTYSWALLKLLEEETDLEDHVFVFGLGKDHPMEYPYSAAMQSRLLFLKKPGDLVKIIRHIYQARWIYIHLLAYDPTLFFWYLNRKLLRKSTWIVWGSDIYAFQKQNQSLRTRTYEWLRHKIIPVFPEIAAFVREDFDVIASIYGTSAGYIPILYPLPVNSAQLDQVVKSQNHGELVVMIGNSGDPTNNHLEMIELLSPFRDEAMKVVCPMAYGGTAEYRQIVKSAGFSTFGDNFIPWLEMKGKQEYAVQLAGVDITIMNHQRQQGLGNILALLYLGKKVFIRSTTTSWAFLGRNNCKVVAVESLNGMDFRTFSEPLAERSETMTNVGKIMQQDYTAGLWKNLLKRH